LLDLPLPSALRSLANGTVLGPEVEKQVNWYIRFKVVGSYTSENYMHYAALFKDLIKVVITRLYPDHSNTAS
jgi:hypothetical protein